MQFNGEGQGRGFYFNPAAAQEASVQLGGQTAEFENGGFQANMIPKDGGNIFSGLFSANYANDEAGQRQPVAGAARPRPDSSSTRRKRTYDANIAVGGPIFKDKLWFFTAHRVFGYQNYLAGNYANATQNTPFYTPDLEPSGAAPAGQLHGRRPLHLSAVGQGQDLGGVGHPALGHLPRTAARWSRRKRPGSPSTPIRTTCCRASGAGSSAPALLRGRPIRR